jgi:hypothetical protein
MNKLFWCEICGDELGEEWVKSHEQMYGYKFLCEKHGMMYMQVKNTVNIYWNNDTKRFEITIHE